jgi:hypothetical protein
MLNSKAQKPLPHEPGRIGLLGRQSFGVRKGEEKLLSLCVFEGLQGLFVLAGEPVVCSNWLRQSCSADGRFSDPASVIRGVIKTINSVKSFVQVDFLKSHPRTGTFFK